MELSIYDIIVGPVVSSKAYQLHQLMKKIMFQVHVEANKPLVREAVTKLFNVEVDSVRIVVRKGKRKVSRSRNVSHDPMKKVAIVTLKKDYDINLFGNVGYDAQANTEKVQEASTEQVKG
ncbi:MAG: 50S ribosomal protein L23 [Epsilonproteobacteria bacterium]|nr:50S ribosomal protein L23 [Campylobacterota bacterium]|tara:strand:- start:2462 stop:2821 length:360 start_codon:yes stop_codon:yes gene_type:complete